MNSSAVPLSLAKFVLMSGHTRDIMTEKSHVPARNLVAGLVAHTTDKRFIHDLVAACLPLDYRGNTLEEADRLVDGAIERGYDQRPATTNKAPSTATMALNAVSDRFEFFHDDYDEGYMTAPDVSGGNIAVPISSPRAAHLIRHHYFKATGRGLPQPALTEAVETLKAIALYNSPRGKTFLRQAEVDRCVYLDLGREDGRCAKITPAGWEIVESVPVRFRRAPGFGELPLPEKGSRIQQLKELFRLGGADWRRLVAFVLSVWNPSGPYMILLVEGGRAAARVSSAIC